MRSLWLSVAVGVLVGVAWAGQTAVLSFVVIRDYNGKPIRNAAVVMHPVNKDGKQARGGIELKADSEGRTSFDGVPYGKLRVQVLAPGFQTFGDDYDVNQPSMEITIKMKRPAEQYSVYEDHPGDKKDDKTDDKKDDKANQPEQKPQ